jgi:hypothetical protein
MEIEPVTEIKTVAESVDETSVPSKLSKKEQLRLYQEAKKLNKVKRNNGKENSTRSSNARKNPSQAMKSSKGPTLSKSSTPRPVSSSSDRKSTSQKFAKVRLAKIHVPEFRLPSQKLIMKPYTKEELKGKIMIAVALLGQYTALKQQSITTTTADTDANNEQANAKLNAARDLMQGLQKDEEFAQVETDSLYWLAWLKMESEAGHYGYCKQIHTQAMKTLMSESSKQILTKAYELYVCNNSCDIPAGTVSKLTGKFESRQTPKKAVVKFIKTINYDQLFQVGHA